jgi:hypothetical protein
MASAWRNGNSSLAATELTHKNDRAQNPQQSNRFIAVLHIENLAKSVENYFIGLLEECR